MHMIDDNIKRYGIPTNPEAQMILAIASFVFATVWFAIPVALFIMFLLRTFTDKVTRSMIKRHNNATKGSNIDDPSRHRY